MKKLFAGLALVVLGAAFVVAAQPGAPEISLRINGLAAGTEPFVLTAGEPVLVEIQLRHPDRRGKEPIRLEPLVGGWAERVKIVVTDGRGAASAWRFVVAGKPSAGGLALQPATVTTLVLRMDQDARVAVVPGSYRMIARLDLGDGRGFRGTVDSEMASVNVVAASTAPVGAVLGRRQLLRVRDALLRGDMPGADTAAGDMLRAEPRRPEGFIAMALVQEARGERSRAILSVNIAISRARGGEEEGLAQEGRMTAPQQPTGPKHPLKPVPVEYYELLRRLEDLPSGPGGSIK